VTFSAALRVAAVLIGAAPLLGGCERPTAEDAPAAGREILTPAERGSRRAEADIAAGRLRIFAYGNPITSLTTRRDGTSGLPVSTLIDCCVTAESREETEAYNRVMREAVSHRADGARDAPVR
jgi:hypothetical protein